MTISSDVFPILTFTLQPVCFSKGVTQSTLGSLDPFSAYPAHAMMLSAPSPAPTEDAMGTDGGAGRAVLLPLLDPPDDPPLEPQAAASRTTAALAVATLSKRECCT